VECSTSKEREDKGRKENAKLLIKDLIKSKSFVIKDPNGVEIKDHIEVDNIIDYN